MTATALEAAAAVEAPAVAERPPAPPRRARWRPDAGTAALIAAAAVCALASVRIPADDAWWQLAYGRYILAHAALPRVDTFSWTAAGHPLVVTEWLFDALMAAATRWQPWGPAALSLGCLLPFGLSAAAVFRRRVGDPRVAGLLAVVLLGLLLPFEPLLPQLASFTLFAAVWWAADSGRRWWLPPLFLLWANVNGTYAIGWALLVVVGVPLPLLAASVAATAVNPYGPHLWAAEFRLAVSPFHQSHIAEFASPNFHLPYLKWFVLPALLAGLGFAARRRPPLRDLLACLGLVAGALVMARVLPYALMAVGVLVADALGRRPEPERPAPWPLIGLAAGAVAVTALVRPPLAWPPTRSEPVAAAAFVAAHEQGHGLDTYSWGGYLLSVWGGHPPVYVDSRGDMYEGTGVLQRYTELTELQVDPGALLASEDVRWALLPSKAPLTNVLRIEGWRTAYRDSLAVVLAAPAQPSARSTASRGSVAAAGGASTQAPAPGSSSLVSPG